MSEDVFEIVGTVVGGSFRVERVVAEGGFAVVYQAYHGAFHAPVALKCLKVPTVRGKEKSAFLEGFREEGELMFRLSQSIPTVVRPLHIDAFETPKGVLVPYMALEWLEGDTLDFLIARRAADGMRPLSPKRVVRMLSPVARALERAHRFPGPDGPVSIVHRDLKPDNIVIAKINGEEIVKILDFGIAKMKSVASQVAGRLSQSSGAAAVPFTPGYAAPEQWLPKRYGQTGPWTDVWGLALCAVESMSGKPAIDGDHAGMMGTAIDGQRRPSPRNEGVSVSDDVERVFLTALRVDPRDRYQSVGKFWNDLEQALGLESSSTRGTGTFTAYQDSRSEGPPAGRVERVTLSKGLSARPSSDGQRDDVLPKQALKPGKLPALNVPDLELHAKDEHPIGSGVALASEMEFDPSVPQKAAPAPASTGGKTPQGPDSTELPSSKPGGSEETAPEPESAQAPPMIEAGLGGGMVADSTGTFAAKGGVPDGPSGIDLAVSPADVRRTSSANMKAVRVSNPKLPVVRESTASDGRPSKVDVPSRPQVSVRNSSAASARSGAYKAVSSRDIEPTSESGTGRRLVVPIVLTVVGFGLAGGYYVSASTGGGRWMLGPIPVTWFAGLFALTGVGLGVWRLLFPADHD